MRADKQAHVWVVEQKSNVWFAANVWMTRRAAECDAETRRIIYCGTKYRVRKYVRGGASEPAEHEGDARCPQSVAENRQKTRHGRAY